MRWVHSFIYFCLLNAILTQTTTIFFIEFHFFLINMLTPINLDRLDFALAPTLLEQSIDVFETFRIVKYCVIENGMGGRFNVIKSCFKSFISVHFFSLPLSPAMLNSVNGFNCVNKSNVCSLLFDHWRHIFTCDNHLCAYELSSFFCSIEIF